MSNRDSRDPSCSNEEGSPCRRYISFLKKEDYDLEKKLHHSSISLFTHLNDTGVDSLVTARLLVDLDANVYATYCQGVSALQYALLSAKGTA